MSPPVERAERITLDVRITSHVAPLVRGADSAARRPYQWMESRPELLVNDYLSVFALKPTRLCGQRFCDVVQREGFCGQ